MEGRNFLGCRKCDAVCSRDVLQIVWIEKNLIFNLESGLFKDPRDR